MSEANKIARAMSKKFNIPIEDILTLNVEGKTAIVYNHGFYPFAGSYEDVMSQPKKDWEIRVGNKRYDTRKGMTDAVYEAKVADARARGVALPDSKQLSEQTGDLWTWTMLTAEPLTADGRVPVRNVDGGRVGWHAVHPESVGRSLRVCPAVVIDLPFNNDPSSDLDTFYQDVQDIIDYLFEKGHSISKPLVDDVRKFVNEQAHLKRKRG